MARATKSYNSSSISGFFVLTAQLITVLFGQDMKERRKQRAADRSANQWFRWEDDESRGWEGEDIFALRSLFTRAENQHDRNEIHRFLRGDHLQGGMGMETPRAVWIRDLREEKRQLDQEAEEKMELLAIDDLWDLRILFGDQEPDPEPTIYELDWDLECWGF